MGDEPLPRADNGAQPPPPVTRRTLLLLLAILGIAAFFRLWDLGGVPNGLFRDEAEKGYTALELWRTARHGEFTAEGAFHVTRPFPFFVEVGGVETSAIYQYLSAPIVGLFGLQPATTRLAAALSGILTVLFAMLLAREVERGASGVAWGVPAAPRPTPQAAALATGVFLALSPVAVLFSRWAQQGVTVPLFTAAGLWMLLLAARIGERHRRVAAAGGGLLLGIAFYAYDPARLVVPFILLGLAWEMAPRRGGEGSCAARWGQLVGAYVPAALAFLAVAVPVFVFAVTRGSERFARVSVFADSGMAEGLLRASMNWLRHFDPRFLLLTGDANARHSMDFAGMVAWAEVPFFLAGLLTLNPLRRDNPGARLLLVWLLAAPLAASMTTEGVPHALRSILFFPVLAMVSGRGFGLILEWKRRAAFAVLATGVAITAALLGIALFVRMPREGAPWQHGALEALVRMQQDAPAAPHVMSAEVPYALYYALFAESLDPALYHKRGPEALRTMILAPGSPLPEGAWVARPPQLFEKLLPTDVPNASGDPLAPPAMKIRQGW